MAERYVLDTSAILTVFENEPGAVEVERLLRGSDAGRTQVLACAITLMEVFYTALREKGEDQAATLLALVKAYPVDWWYPDEKTLLQASRLKVAYRLSVADALIAATAKLHDAVLAHRDPELEALRGEIELLSLPFKRGTRRA